MIRLALPKGRNLEPALAAFRAAGIPLLGLDPNGRSLRTRLAEGVEVLSLKDWDLPLYVEHGVADCGIVGSDVLAEVDGDLLVPVRLREGRSRMSLIGRSAESMPAPGGQVRLATKYPNTARRIVDERPWGAEIVKLSGSIELAPILHLAELALDIVQTGRTLKENGLVEIETVAEVASCLVVNRASFQRHRTLFNDWIGRLEAAEVVS
jgi:ATP phosphoribosyltransferase